MGNPKGWDMRILLQPLDPQVLTKLPQIYEQIMKDQALW